VRRYVIPLATALIAGLTACGSEDTATNVPAAAAPTASMAPTTATATETDTALATETPAGPLT
jgi:hypothetical protein